MLELALETSPNRLDPAFVVDARKARSFALIFDGLSAFAPDGAMVPALREAWSVSDDGRRYRVRARYTRAFRQRASRLHAAGRRRQLSPRARSASSSPRAWVLPRIRGRGAFPRRRDSDHCRPGRCRGFHARDRSR
jgi:hypothetical protein